MEHEWNSVKYFHVHLIKYDNAFIVKRQKLVIQLDPDIFVYQCEDDNF